MFKSFLSTVSPPLRRIMGAYTRLLHDPVTGAPVGIENPNANGADGIFIPVDLTAAQILSPTAEMIADLNATYRLSVAPYTRYQSNGTTLVGLAESPDAFIGLPAVLQTVPSGTPQLTVGPNSYLDIWAPWTIQSIAGVSIQGRADVKTRPA